MTCIFGWVDQLDRERTPLVEISELFRECDTGDELCIAVLTQRVRASPGSHLGRAKLLDSLLRMRGKTG